jgi:GWxTD domain-containing protein
MASVIAKAARLAGHGWIAAGLAVAIQAAEPDRRAWLEQVHLLILPAEEKVFRDLAREGDRAEFERIFWARRDPDPGTEANDLRDLFDQRRARADALFRIPGKAGSRTGCGQLLALLGEPFEVRGRELQARFDNSRDIREGPRRPETWTYRSRPGDRRQYAGGELRIELDDACRFAEGGRVLEELRSVAQSLVVRPELDYRRGPDGRLIPLQALGPAAATAIALLDERRRDFAVAVEPKLVLRLPSGEVYAAALVRLDAGALAGADKNAKRQADVRVVARAVGAAGERTVTSDRRMSVSVEPDGTALASYGLRLEPGRYTVDVGVASTAGEKAAVTSAPLEVPDLGGPELAIASVLVLPYAEAGAGPDPTDPLAAFAVGSLRLRPRFGNVFSAADRIEVLGAVYNGRSDGAGKASLKARFTIVKDGKPVAKGGDQLFDTAAAVASVGPVPLAGFEPGRYTARLEVADEVAGTTAVKDAPFEVQHARE